MTPAELSGKKGQALGLVAREYERITCRTVSRKIIDDSADYLDRGLESDVIIRSIEITEEKKADWRYTKAILERLVSEEIFKLDIWEDRLRFKKAMNELRKRCPNSSEADLFPFAVVKAYRYILDEMEEKIKSYDGAPFNLDDICEPD